jgi:hypothetical protein
MSKARLREIPRFRWSLGNADLVGSAFYDQCKGLKPRTLENDPSPTRGKRVRHSRMNNGSLAGMKIKTPHAYRNQRCGTRNSQRNGTEERRRQLIQMTVDDLGDLLFGDGAHDLVGDLAALEDQ